MRVTRRVIALAALAVLGWSSHASAQFGWGGWGGANTVAGSAARGMGAFSAGAGYYNEQTAEARSINANTAMQVDQYMWQQQQGRNRSELEHMARRQQLDNKSLADLEDRLHNNPTPQDVESGDAMNVVLDDLTNPKIYGLVVQSGTTQVPADLVRHISFEFAPQAMTMCLSELSEKGPPTVLYDPKFSKEFKAGKAAVVEARKQAQEKGSIDHATLEQVRAAVKALKTKVDADLPSSSPDRLEADHYFKAIYGLSKMLDTPELGKHLEELKTVKTVPVGNLVKFMHLFNLRFGVANTPEEKEAYDELYPVLVQLRDGVGQPPAPSPGETAAAAPNYQSVVNFFARVNHPDLPPTPGAGTTPPPRPMP